MTEHLTPEQRKQVDEAAERFEGIKARLIELGVLGEAEVQQIERNAKSMMKRIKARMKKEE